MGICFKWQEHGDEPCDNCGKTREVITKSELIENLMKIISSFRKDEEKDE
jgi:hypothetical protein